MNPDGRGILGDWDATGAEIAEAMGVAVRNAIREHKVAGRSIIVWDRETKQTNEIPAELIEIPGEADALTTSNASDVPG